MLDRMDLEFIKESREEIRKLREKIIEIISNKEVGRHPITDEPEVVTVVDEVVAVVTVISVRTAVDREVIQGIELINGDVIIDINIEDFPAGISDEDVISFNYLDVNYTVVASGLLGLGDYNRYELLGRRTK